MMTVSSWRPAAAVIAAFILLAGCTGTPESPLPNAEVRAQYGQMGVVPSPHVWRALPERPVKRSLRGIGHGMAKGAAVGAHLGGYAGLHGGRAAIILVPAGIIVGAPVGAIIGGLNGTISARSGKTVDTAAAALRRALQSAQPGKELRNLVVTGTNAASTYRLVARPATAYGNNYAGLGMEGDKTVLEITVGFVRLEREGTKIYNPSVRLHIAVGGRIVRTADNVQIYQRTWTYVSRERRYFSWAKNDAALLRAEIAAAYDKLGDQILRDLFDVRSRRSAEARSARRRLFTRR